MKIRRAVISLGLITLIYLAALIWVDSRNNVFGKLPELAGALLFLMGFSLLSYLLRYCRWHWLLSGAGYPVPRAKGFLAYLSGFAFTATPGKVGELLRIRYFAPFGVPAQRVISAFVYERAFDLLAVLFISTLAATQFGMFGFAASFVALVVTVVVLLARYPRSLGLVAVHFRRHRFGRLSKLTIALRNGIQGARTWADPRDASLSFGIGLLAWSLTSFSFVWLLARLGEPIPFMTAIAVYPLAMLAGAASMLPGGVGSTEAAIVALLTVGKMPLGAATLAAVGIRLSTLWFAIVCGLFAAAVLEWQAYSAGSNHHVKLPG
jgi:uncharacterized protein (TIRG00374 family)